MRFDKHVIVTATRLRDSSKCPDYARFLLPFPNDMTARTIASMTSAVRLPALPHQAVATRHFLSTLLPLNSTTKQIDFVVDAGAHVGCDAANLALVYPSATIVALESEELPFACLKYNMSSESGLFGDRRQDEIPVKPLRMRIEDYFLDAARQNSAPASVVFLRASPFVPCHEQDRHTERSGNRIRRGEEESRELRIVGSCESCVAGSKNTEGKEEDAAGGLESQEAGSFIRKLFRERRACMVVLKTPAHQNLRRLEDDLKGRARIRQSLPIITEDEHASSSLNGTNRQGTRYAFELHVIDPDDK